MWLLGEARVHASHSTATPAYALEQRSAAPGRGEATTELRSDGHGFAPLEEAPDGRRVRSKPSRPDIHHWGTLPT